MASRPANDVEPLPKKGRYPLFPYNDDQADEICQRLAQGESLIGICNDEHLPPINSVYHWRRTIPVFAIAYTRAREDQADTNADEIAEVRRKIESGEVDASAGRVIIDALKWEAGKRKAKMYGDSSLLKLADADGEKLLPQGFDASNLSIEERDALRQLMTRALAPPPPDAEYEEVEDEE